MTFKLVEIDLNLRCSGCGYGFKRLQVKAVQLSNGTRLCKNCIEELYMASVESIRDLTKLVENINE